MTAAPERYRPSNGSEGDWFMGKFCERCTRDADEDKPCMIQGNALAFGIDDPDYPKEWVIGPQGPTCTAFTTEPVSEPNTIDDARQTPLF